MTRDEMLRILNFVDRGHELGIERTHLATVDPRWNIISYAMRGHLEGRLLTITSLAEVAGVPYGTAIRRIEGLVDEGLLMKRVRSKSGKSYSIHPTRSLIKEFETYAVQLKAHIASTFGFDTKENSTADFYFGGSYMAARILSFPNAMRQGVGYDRPMRILCNSDPTFKTLNDFSSNLNEFCGGTLEIINLPLDDLREEIIANGQRKHSAHDIVAIDIPWVGELAENRIILPLDGIIERERFSHTDFHSTAWRGSRYHGQQYGIPIQPTYELLFYRTDLFAEAGLDPPSSTEDTLFAARTLHRSTFHLSGIVMNYGRGTPVAHTFMQTMAAFGQPIINLDNVSRDFDTAHMAKHNYRPAFCSEKARLAAEYLMELKAYAHPDSMRCSWDRRIEIFSKGQAAMTYGWSIRAAAFEFDDNCPAHGRTGFAPHPHGPEAPTVCPTGGFSLSIPANLNEYRIKNAWKLIEFLTRPELMKWYAQNGSLVSPRFSTSVDPEVQALSPLIRLVDNMERRGDLQIWPRPPIPEFTVITQILGQEIHAMLRGDTSITAALSSSQKRVDALMRENQRY